MMTDRELQLVVEDCRSEPELDRQIDLLHRLNQSLPAAMQIKIPSLLTNDFVDRALDLIEEKVIPSRNTVQIQSGFT